MGIGNLLLVPEADYNLLGRDLIIEMGINIEVVNEEIKIKLCPLRVEDEEKINSEVWYTPDSVGRLNIPPFSVIIKDPETPIRVKQYPISPEGAEIVDCTCCTRLKGIRCDTPPVKYRNWDSYVKRQQSRPREPPEEYPCCQEDGTPVARGNRVDGKGRGVKSCGGKKPQGWDNKTIFEELPQE
ncbi:hypothetical protein DUI87_30899 [Hirundo rustica rustica]|uniref:Uncharacterized protein n=1 Tax=Hirundo rustica rustica TaxID=333673 RepID=A0A3M0IXA8_HIRRU|nr:hypothetical protein DUI87_30899 [Hirundo rustica rustica]